MNGLEVLNVTSESRLIPNGKLYKRLLEGSYGCKTSNIRSTIKASADERIDSLFYRLAMQKLSHHVRAFMSDTSCYGPGGVKFDASARKAFREARVTANGN